MITARMLVGAASLVGIVAGTVVGAHATVIVGGRTFADNAFADAVTIPPVTHLIWDGVTPNVETTTDASRAQAALLDTPITQPVLSTSTLAACIFLPLETGHDGLQEAFAVDEDAVAVEQSEVVWPPRLPGIAT